MGGKEYNRLWRQNNPEKEKANNQKGNKKKLAYRGLAIKKIDSNMYCADHILNYGCLLNDLRVLEIHHINGRNGERDGLVFYKNIADGIRKIDDLILLCANCHKIRHRI